MKETAMWQNSFGMDKTSTARRELLQLNINDVHKTILPEEENESEAKSFFLFGMAEEK